MKRSPIKRKSSKASIKKKLDDLCRQIVFARDSNTCRRCNRPSGIVQLQWAHIYSRRYLSLRWMPLNGLSLCAACHFWIHANPMDGAEFVRGSIGLKNVEKLRDALNANQKPDLDKTGEDLAALLGAVRNG